MYDSKNLIKSNYTNRDVNNFIKILESKLDLKKWYLKEINVWTFFRNSIASSLAQSRQRNCKTLDFDSSNSTQKSQCLPKILKIIFLIAQATLGLCQYFKLFFLNLYKFQRIPILLVSDGISKSYLNNVWIDKFLDPLRSYYHNQKQHSILVDVNKFPQKKRHSTTFNIHYLERTSYLFARVASFFWKKNTANDEQFAILQEELKNYQIQISDYSKEVAVIKYYQVIFLASFIKCVIKFFGISKIYIVAYYNVQGYAVSLAANQANIKCIDIQHGVTEGHPAYECWSEVSSKNLLLPNLFWLWSKSSYLSFKQHNPSTFLQFHKPFFKELPWKLWDQALTHFKDSSFLLESGKVHILITMQPEVFGRNLWKNLTSIIKKNTHYCWWIRRHPAFFDQCTYLDELNQPDYAHVNFKDAFKFPIYSFLNRCTLHITTDSSSALDAEAFNVPTLFLSNLCYDFFPSLMIERKGIYFESYEDIEKYIDSLVPKS